MTLGDVVRRDRQTAIRFIICLGAVSLFADMTYEGAYSIMGPYLKELGATATQVGIIAGLGEMLAASLRYFSGRLADRTRAYWAITLSGYAVNVLVVPALAFATTWQAAALLIIAERTGKALRGPARDVLLSRATGKVGHGWGFGLHAAMDQTGAVLGPLLMVVSVARLHHFAPAFLRLVVPAVLALLAIIVAYRVDPSRAEPPAPPTKKELPQVFWLYVVGAGILAFGFLDFPLLSYHFQNKSLVAPETIPLMYAGAMGVIGVTALICGKLFDRFGVMVLVVGVLVSMLAVPLGFLGGPIGIAVAVGCWGIGHGVQDATLRPGIAQAVSMNKRGNAFGIFNGVYGVMWFLGSSLMGVLYDHSILWLVAFGLAAQFAAVLVFLRLKRLIPLPQGAAA